MIRRQHLLLTRAFQAALLSIAAPAAIQACGGDDASSPSNDAGTLDATHADADTGASSGDDQDGATTIDARADAALDAKHDADAATDAEQVSCWADVTVVDAGLADGDGGDSDAEEMCAYDFACGLPQGITAVGCDIYSTDTDGAPLEAGQLPCRLYEGRGCAADAFAPTDGAMTFYCIGCASAGGRRPAGMRRTNGVQSETILGAYFAELARLEAASVDAFYILRDELRAHDAPARLVRATGRCARDEARHARVTSRLARAHRGIPRFAKVRAKAPRTLEKLARENAVEGCVRETFGALVAQHQAQNARDPRVARALHRIASDETRHAAVAWAIAAWADARLDVTERKRIARARNRAVRALRSEIAREPSATLVAQAGLPRAADALRMLDTLAHTLWSEARATRSPIARG